VGKAELEVASFHQLIEEGGVEVAGPALPASGLYLERVTYPEGLLAQSTDRTSAYDND
jgi:tRNA U38,U39,U40 pseudouridine synthase TruA